MDKQRPVNKVAHNDAYSASLMKMYENWMGGDCFQGSNISEAFAGMDPQSHGAEVEDTTKKKKKIDKKEKSVAEDIEILEREEYEIDGVTYVIEKQKGLDGKACWKGYKLAGTKKKGGKTVDNCVKEEKKEKCPKCEGKGCGHCNDTGYHMKEYFEKENGKMVKKHNCAAKVKKEGKEYFCIPEQHTMLEDGTVTHYDLISEKGEVLRNVPVSDLEIVVEKMHEHVVNYAKNAEVLGEKKEGYDVETAEALWAEVGERLEKLGEMDGAKFKVIGEKLDPVGKADADIDNDGDVDKSDKYLHARRKKISKIMAMKKKSK